MAPAVAASPPSLTQTTYETLRADILSCRLFPGERIKINRICERVNGNLSAVREALSRLAAEGLVIAEPQKGFRIAPVSLADLQDLTRVRIEIESLCIRSALANMTVQEEAALIAIHHRLSRIDIRRPEDEDCLNDDWAAIHEAFHAALVAACDSPWLLRIRETLYDQSERYRQLSVPLDEVQRDIPREHKDILDAVISRDVDGAISLLTAHFEATTSIISQHLDCRNFEAI